MYIYVCNNVFMPVQPMLHHRHVITASVLSSITCQTYLFHFTRILNGIWWNLREVMTTKNRLNDYILGEIGTGTKEQDTGEN